MVAGNVSKPGVYTLSGNSNGLQALLWLEASINMEA